MTENQSFLVRFLTPKDIFLVCSTEVLHAPMRGKSKARSQKWGGVITFSIFIHQHTIDDNFLVSDFKYILPPMLITISALEDMIKVLAMYDAIYCQKIPG